MEGGSACDGSGSVARRGTSAGTLSPVAGSNVAQGVATLRGWTAAIGNGPQGHGVQAIA
jgi:hypothetical protein